MIDHQFGGQSDIRGENGMATVCGDFGKSFRCRNGLRVSRVLIVIAVSETVGLGIVLCGENDDVDGKGFILKIVVRRFVHPVDQHKSNGIVGLGQRKFAGRSEGGQVCHITLFKLPYSVAVLNLNEVKPQGRGQIARDLEVEFDFGGDGAGVADGQQLCRGHARLPVAFGDDGGSVGVEVLPVGFKIEGLTAVDALEGKPGRTRVGQIESICVDCKVAGRNDSRSAK